MGNWRKCIALGAIGLSAAVAGCSSSAPPVQPAGLASLSAILKQANVQSNSLASFESGIQNCTLSQAEAESQVVSLVNQEALLIASLTNLQQPNVTAQVATLAQELKQTFQAVQNAMSLFQPWMTNSYLPATCVTSSDHQSGVAQSDAWGALTSSTIAGLKSQFAARYNPLAAQYGLPHNWGFGQGQVNF